MKKKHGNNFLNKDEIIRYGSDEKHQFNYICPKFWCLKNNTYIPENEIVEETIHGKPELVHKPKPGEESCGKVLPKNKNKVQKGYYIYQFNDNKYPGLIHGKHPKGLCVPCCFKKSITAKKKCILDKSKKTRMTKENEDKEEEKYNEEKEEEKDNEEKEEEDKNEREGKYILGEDKYPLDPTRNGYLPASLQLMFNEMQIDTNCKLKQLVYKKTTNTAPCLLRHGVEINKNQSFVAAISSILFYGKNDEEVLSIKEMKEYIIQSINMDSYITYQNGNLVSQFYDNTRIIREEELDKYKNTKLYKKIKDSKEEHAYFARVVCSFEHFISFLKDDQAVIDHTYLWDIISMPNPRLFPNGVNIIIFRLPKDDVSNNVELLCPSNHYSSELFQPTKSSILLVKIEEYYEPLYSYFITNKKNIIVKEFKNNDKQLKHLFTKLIVPFYDKICRPVPTRSNQLYHAIEPLGLNKLIMQLQEYKYEIQHLVMNFNNKIIGLVAREHTPTKIKSDFQTKTAFIPCYPTSMDESVVNLLGSAAEFVFMDEDDLIWTTYEFTLKFYNNLYKRSIKKRNTPTIPYKIAFQVVDDNVVVGFLLNSNQFVQLSEPVLKTEMMVDKHIPFLENSNYIVQTKDRPMKQVDEIITGQNEADVEREEYIKKIRLETSFYNTFRNTIRMLLHTYEHLSIREYIIDELRKEYNTYFTKFHNINAALKRMVGQKIRFYTMTEDTTQCILKNPKDCVNKYNLCFGNNGDCIITLPKQNLITDKDNKVVFFGQMTDELIRYKRIRTFMLNPNKYILFGKIDYNLNTNELLLTHSSLTKEYFENITISKKNNNYAQLTTYDEMNPLNAPLYKYNHIRLDEQNCKKMEDKKIESLKWNHFFPEQYKERDYGSNPVCLFQLVCDLLNQHTKSTKSYTLQDIFTIKQTLYKEYTHYLEQFQETIIQTWMLEGKKNATKVMNGEISVENFIFDDTYLLSALDLWLLVHAYTLPTVFISNLNILETKYNDNNSNIMIGYHGKDDIDTLFSFIFLPALKSSTAKHVKLIVSDENQLFINLDNLSEQNKEYITTKIKESQDKHMNIEQYLRLFSTIKDKKTKHTLISENINVVISDSD